MHTPTSPHLPLLPAGEMADADFGYVGGAPGKIDLYVGKEVIKRGIPMEQVGSARVGWG